MMVLKFEDYINEGLWSKGLERAQTGEERIGDKVDSNINELDGVDLGLPFLIADENLEIEGKSEFTFDEMNHYKKMIEKNGWRIPTIEDLQSNLEKPFLEYTTDGGVNAIITNKNNNNSITFKFSLKHHDILSFWLVDSPIKGPNGENRERYWKLMLRHTFSHEIVNSFPNEVYGDFSEKYIRLIKDK